MQVEDKCKGSSFWAADTKGEWRLRQNREEIDRGDSDNRSAFVATVVAIELS